MDIEIYSIISTILSLIFGGGWFVYYKANKKKANGEATQAEAEGWKAQQEVYQSTIADLKESCEYIRNDRNLLREENRKLREENNILREKINEMEASIFDLQNQVARQGRKLEAMYNERKGKKDANTKEGK